MPAYATASIDFGYPWWLSYGHLPILAAAVSILLLGYARKWSRWLMLFLGVVALSGPALHCWWSASSSTLMGELLCRRKPFFILA